MEILLYHKRDAFGNAENITVLGNAFQKKTQKSLKIEIEKVLKTMKEDNNENKK